MRTILLFCTLLFVLSPLKAQDELYKYDRIPEGFQQVFNDVGRECATGLITTKNGQYWGQMRNGILYGYGIYIANDGSQWVGQYREGECIFGLMIDSSTATIGSKSFYTVYDLTSCELKRIHKDGFDVTPDAQQCTPYRFEAMNYANGDRYVGETYNGKRHGYGIYYWNDGKFWYGQYKENIRDGYGILFGEDHKVLVRKWLGNDLVKMGN